MGIRNLIQVGGVLGGKFGDTNLGHLSEETSRSLSMSPNLEVLLEVLSSRSLRLIHESVLLISWLPTH